jgi:hypothetical protein
MNIFILDIDPPTAAKYHCDKHVCKMILESGQMLCTAHWVKWLEKLGKTRSDFRLVRDIQNYLFQNIPENSQPPWKLTHMNHPCSIWTRESYSNYAWHLDLMRNLLSEFGDRYNKKHKSWDVLSWLEMNKPPGLSTRKNLSPFPICMKEEYKISKDPVECYREYYLKDKVRFAKWKNGNIPDWWHV